MIIEQKIKLTHILKDIHILLSGLVWLNTNMVKLIMLIIAFVSLLCKYNKLLLSWSPDYRINCYSQINF